MCVRPIGQKSGSTKRQLMDYHHSREATPDPRAYALRTIGWCMSSCRTASRVIGRWLDSQLTLAYSRLVARQASLTAMPYVASSELKGRIELAEPTAHPLYLRGPAIIERDLRFPKPTVRAPLSSWQMSTLHVGTQSYCIMHHYT